MLILILFGSIGLGIFILALLGAFTPRSKPYKPSTYFQSGRKITNERYW